MTNKNFKTEAMALGIIVYSITRITKRGNKGYEIVWAKKIDHNTVSSATTSEFFNQSLDDIMILAEHNKHL